jgi:hypothetical protein
VVVVERGVAVVVGQFNGHAIELVCELGESVTEGGNGSFTERHIAS